jgi:hypothetical protein
LQWFELLRLFVFFYSYFQDLLRKTLQLYKIYIYVCSLIVKHMFLWNHKILTIYIYFGNLLSFYGLVQLLQGFYNIWGIARKLHFDIAFTKPFVSRFRRGFARLSSASATYTQISRNILCAFIPQVNHFFSTCMYIHKLQNGPLN